MKEKRIKNIPTKNYIICFMVIIFAIIATLYFFSWKNAGDQEKLITSYLVSTNTVSLEINTLEELDELLNESPSDYFIFTGYTGDVNEYNLEVDLKKIIDDYSVSDVFYYLNVTGNETNEEYINELEDILSTEINSLPAIILVSNDTVANKLTSEDEYLKASDIEKMLEMHSFKKSN